MKGMLLPIRIKVLHSSIVRFIISYILNYVSACYSPSTIINADLVVSRGVNEPSYSLKARLQLELNEPEPCFQARLLKELKLDDLGL